MRFTSSGELVTGLDRYMVDREETVGDFNCHVLMHYNELNAGEKVDSVYLYETEGKLYRVPENCRSIDDMEILFNFDCKAGDKFEYSTKNPMIEKVTLEIYETDSIRTDTYAALRRLHTSQGVWIEGVGSADSYGIPPVVMPTNGDVRVFVGCYDDNISFVFHNDFTRAAYTGEDEEPDSLEAPGIATADGVSAENPDAIFDLLGRRVENPVKGGFYVSAGKIIRI